MSVKALLVVGNEEHNLLDYEFSIIQGTDHEGRPSTTIHGGKFQCSFSVDDDEKKSKEFFAFAVDPFAHKDLSVKVCKRTEDSVGVTYKLKEAFCVGYTEKMTTSAGDNSPRVISVTLSAKEITNDDASHGNKWDK